MTLLSALKTRLEANVPADNGVPSSTQYEQAIKDAVADFARRTGRIKIGTLSIVSGTATYDLPADFQKMIELLSFNYAGTIVTDRLIPMDPQMMAEKFIVSNRQITLYPTPGYTMDRDFRYKAGWALSGDTFAEMGDLEEDIVILKAEALALEKQANVPAGGLNKYSFGAVSVDKSGDGDEKRTNAEKRQRDYEIACDGYNGRAVAWG